METCWQPSTFALRGRVDQSIARVKKPLPGHHRRPLLLKMAHEDAQGLHNVVGVDLDPPGNNLGVDKTLAIKKGHHYLLSEAGLDSSLDGA
jgi:hypothetical protein